MLSDKKAFNRTARWGLQMLLAGGLVVLLSLGATAGQAQIFDADVALDPGHSRVDVGTSGAGLREFEVALEIGERVRERLEQAGVSVRMTRTDHEPLSAMNHPDSTERVRIEQEARLAKAGRVRAYVSIHFNGHPSPSLRGTETYYNPDGVAGNESYKLAEALQRNVVNALWEGGYPAVDRGVKSDLLAGKPYGHFFGLRGSAPSALVEGLFMSAPGEAAALTQPTTRDALAWGYVRGIREYLAAGLGSNPANLSFQQTAMASSTMVDDILD